MGDDELAALLASSDDRLAAAILAATGVPASAVDIRRWRAAISRLLYRRRQAREGRPAPPPPEPTRAYRAAQELVIDFLGSPEGSLLVAACLAALAVPPALVAAARAAYGLRARAHGLPPPALDRAFAYASAKIAPGGATPDDLWLAASLDPRIVAAINAASPERLTWIVRGLDAARATVRARSTVPNAASVSDTVAAHVLATLCERGAEALAVYPDLYLGLPTPGPSLGVWPPPPPSPDPAPDVDAPPVQERSAPASRR